ncbi:hypothetical protein GCM10010169_21510 [Micromonospora fulviviridis]|nr:glycerate kinase [Micromonospora fulviviridis]GGR77013.1 hypothetical protein GCM10010169_21510 [Micromonospora fulviviridis]
MVARAALAAGVTRLVIGLGGSASTDGGAGALRALGLRLQDNLGRDLPLGGAALADLAHLDSTYLLPAPPGGVQLLVDVTAPLTGPAGAAAVYGPQKGADPADVTLLDAALRRLAELAGGDPDESGAGAAGGTAYGLAAVWGPGSCRARRRSRNWSGWRTRSPARTWCSRARGGSTRPR